MDAPSGTMYLHQTGTLPGAFPPNIFTLDFATSLDSFGFSESAILVPSITAPCTATAYAGAGGTGTVLDIASFGGSVLHPTLLFTLTGPSIASVTFFQFASSSAAFFSANLDDFILTGPGIGVPEPATLASMSLGLLGLGFNRRKRLQ